MISKILTLFKYIFSSFMGIELFAIILLLFLILLFINKSEKKLFKLMFSLVFLVFLLFIFIYYRDFSVASFDYFVKKLMNYYYFPSIGLYFMIIVCVSILLFISILYKKCSKVFKYSVYLLSFLVYLLFVQFVGFVISNKIELVVDISIYSNSVILAIVQLSNLFTFLWILFILIYKFYLFLKKKFD